MTSGDAPWRYRIYGLETHSAIEMPYLAPGAGGTPDVVITSAPLPEDDGEDHDLQFRNWRARADRMRLEIPSIGRFLVTGGDTIQVEPAAGTDDADLVPHLQGSTFAALLQQRGVLPMHAASIETRQGAVLFTGSSGSGKSTLLSSFLARGFRLIADDVTAIERQADGLPCAIPAFPATRLWRDSAEAAGHDVAELQRVRGSMDKYYVPVPEFRPDPQPLHAIVVLKVGSDDQPRIEEMTPGERVQSLARFTYRKNFLAGQHRHEMQFACVSEMASTARIVRLERPGDGPDRGALADMVIDAFGLQPSGPSQVP